MDSGGALGAHVICHAARTTAREPKFDPLPVFWPIRIESFPARSMTWKEGLADEEVPLQGGTDRLCPEAGRVGDKGGRGLPADGRIAGDVLPLEAVVV